MDNLKRLPELGAGQKGIVKKVLGGRHFVQRLAEIGIPVGTELRVVRGKCPMIIEVKNQRLVLGRGMVDKIQVESLSAD